ncbi:hypothetical protein GH714_023230 [Hevea brasiliensis]|uniref:Uncharacterized protein n=1 Tax=Hevea brasiliensis TaxID=3981 RepID=A0A6A6L7L3_HEVBR|nr:hypothetical protein GH714_023230 [Hevea brasiliensis]
MVADKLAVSSNMGMRLLAAAPRNVLELLHMDMQGSLGLRKKHKGDTPISPSNSEDDDLETSEAKRRRRRKDRRTYPNDRRGQAVDVYVDAKIKLKKEQEQFKVELKAMRDTAHWRRHKPGMTMQSSGFSNSTREGHGDTSVWTQPKKQKSRHVQNAMSLKLLLGSVYLFMIKMMC